MKHINYSFSDSDIDTILFTLTILPSIGLEETEVQAAINYQCCCSAGEKLINRSMDISPDEFRVIYASLQAAQMVNQGMFNIDDDVRKKCAHHMFSINKLVSDFDKQMS